MSLYKLLTEKFFTNKKADIKEVETIDILKDTEKELIPIKPIVMDKAYESIKLRTADLVKIMKAIENISNGEETSDTLAEIFYSNLIEKMNRCKDLDSLNDVIRSIKNTEINAEYFKKFLDYLLVKLNTFNFNKFAITLDIFSVNREVFSEDISDNESIKLLLEKFQNSRNDTRRKFEIYLVSTDKYDDFTEYSRKELVCLANFILKLLESGELNE